MIENSYGTHDKDLADQTSAEQLSIGPDRVRIFIENPLQNTNPLHIKMKMPPKVFCMRVNRTTLSIEQLCQLIAARIKLDLSLWRITGLFLVKNSAEIDCASLLESGDTVRVHLESSISQMSKQTLQKSKAVQQIINVQEPPIITIETLKPQSLESQIQTEILLKQVGEK